MNATPSRPPIFATIALLGVWFAVSQTFTPFYVALGLAASCAVAWLNARRGEPSSTNTDWVRIAAYIPWLLWKIVQSGVHVSYLILHPRLPINPGFIRCHTKLGKPLAVVTLGNSITLTPGTITAEVSSTEILVHAIDEKSAADLKSFRLERKVARIFGGK